MKNNISLLAELNQNTSLFVKQMHCIFYNIFHYIVSAILLFIIYEYGLESVGFNKPSFIYFFIIPISLFFSTFAISSYIKLNNIIKLSKHKKEVFTFTLSMFIFCIKKGYFISKFEESDTISSSAQTNLWISYINHILKKHHFTDFYNKLYPLKDNYINNAIKTNALQFHETYSYQDLLTLKKFIYENKNLTNKDLTSEDFKAKINKLIKTKNKIEVQNKLKNFN